MTALLRVMPAVDFGSRRSLRLIERNLYVYKHGWMVLLSGFFEPLFYLLSIGVGLSHLVGPINVDGRLVPYTAFVAPGLLASSAMNGPEVSWPFVFFVSSKKNVSLLLM